jgi:hypothetical protein
MTKTKKTEKDSVYFLKILLFFIIGSLWIHVGSFKILPGINSLPVGLVLGLLFAHHEHFQIDRKVEYAILLAAAILSFVAPVGVVVRL